MNLTFCPQSQERILEARSVTSQGHTAPALGTPSPEPKATTTTSSLPTAGLTSDPATACDFQACTVGCSFCIVMGGLKAANRPSDGREKECVCVSVAGPCNNPHLLKCSSSTVHSTRCKGKSTTKGGCCRDPGICPMCSQNP